MISGGTDIWKIMSCEVMVCRTVCTLFTTVDMLQHNTCPICRKTLGTSDADAEEYVSVHEATDATDSNSTDSSDDDVNSASSNELADSAITGSLSVTEAQPSDEPPPADSDIPHWDIRPDGATHQVEQVHCHRSRSKSSSSSSSSEYSSL